VAALGRLLEFVRTHPNLPRRVAQLREYAHAHGSPHEETSPCGERGWVDRAAVDASRPLATTLVASRESGGCASQ
jgi:hypothetical protein